MKNYINENWPTGNSKPGVFYALAIEGHHTRQYYTVDDLETAVQQINRNGWKIKAAHRIENGNITPFIPETRREKTDRENRNHCRHIAEELEAYTSGTVYRCPDCGEVIQLPETVGDRYRCPGCGTTSDVDDLEQLGLYDFLEDALDIEYRIGSDRKTVNSIRVMVACGGPNIYIDTNTCAVELYWWGDRASYPIDSDSAAELDAWAEELWSC